MKLTKKQEKEIWQVYDTWLYSYLNGDVKTYKKYLDKDYHFIGSTDNEEFLNKKDTANFFKETADQLAGKCDLRNENKIIEKFEGLVFITHLFDAWFKNGDDYSYYGRFRFTNALKENKDGWRFIYQHFSTTDSKTDEGETIGFDKVNLENKKLHEAIKRRTFELEQKNRELEVETALEKVRSRTMAMQHSDELQEASFLLDEQVRALGIKTWGCAFNIYGENESTEWFGNESGVLPKYTVPRKGIFKKYYDKGQKGESLFIQEFSGEECVAHYEFMSTLPVIGEVLKNLKKTNNGFPTYQIDHVVYFKYGYLLFITKEPVPESHEVFKRFAKVFEQTYTRFLDLQKAEAQAREAQIEAALERVRAASMAMHKTEDLYEVVIVYFEQLKLLEIEFIQSWITIFNLDKGFVDVWFSPLEGIYKDPKHFKMPSALFEDTSIKSWKEGLPFSNISFKTKAEVDGFMQVCDDVTNTNYFGKTQKKLKLERFEMLDANHKYGCISKSNIVEATTDEKDILQRFATVFEQTYTRFLDLQKSENQAREAQIEVAMERIRSRSLAMHTSEELMDVITELRRQIDGLGQLDLEASVIHLYNDNDSMFESIAAVRPPGETGEIVLANVFFPVDATNQIKHMLKMYASDETEYTIEFDKKMAEEWQKTMMKYAPEIATRREGFVENRRISEHSEYWNFADFSDGSLLLVTHSPASEDTKEVLRKAAQVFDLAYRRFKDLKKAEAQAREAKIEAALEKVRSRSLAMQNAEELKDVVMVIVDKLTELGVILDANGITLCTYFPESKDVLHWIASPDLSHVGKYLLPYFDHVIFKDAWHSKEQGDAYFSKAYSVKDKNSFFEHAFEHSDYKHFPDEVKEWIFKNDKHILSFAWQKNSALLIPSNTGVLPTEDDKDILIRFSKVFEQAYIRFMDLQKAEEQARKAQIEASLERVRAKAMSMQNSDELDEVLSVLCEQFDVLGIVPMSTHMTVLDFDNNTFTFRETGKFGNRSFGEQTVALDAMDNWKETVDKWKADKATAINKLHFPKEQLPKVWEVFHESFSSMPEGSRITPKDYPDGIYHTAGKHPFGYIGMNQVRPATEEEEQIVIKFANEFGMAYQRFLDLKKAEAQAREAQIETALEKVRSRTMAMQHSDELPEAANNLFLQVQALGIPVWSAGYNILSTDKSYCTCFMSSEGEIQEGFKLPLNEHASLIPWFNALKSKKEFFVYGQDGENLVAHYNYMKSLPDLKETFKQLDKAGIELPTIQFNHLVRFNEGFLLFITYQAVPEVHDIFKRFGKVFEQTYTRFLDLKKAEAQSNLIKKEKERLEVTLSELKATQSQLIQSEKMASLGELTAGIAHEIQNPLNFVNNFSEVSKELLDEMIEELDNGDMEEVKAITDDVIQNLEKINHHGKRADSIVKGMLQHSRATGDKKEPANINALADEYLRLAYHGLRAKDKSFNASLVTDFDDSIENINILPQDIGRVILNLLTNAFYVVNEKKKANQNGYEPTVALTTKKNGNWVTISVKDNGNGIPKQVLDKIFQPFFTTKPTGQGTGLGLSMSYDIITKGHGGELKVNTKQGVGTEFIIKLPI